MPFCGVPMNDITLTLDGCTLTVRGDGSIVGDHELVPVCNAAVSRQAYTPNRQHTAVNLLKRLGALVTQATSGQLLAYPVDHDPLVWY